MSKSKDSQPTPGKIFVGGLAQGTTEQQISEHFAKFGKIEKTELFIVRGFSYVTYTNDRAVEKCLEEDYHVVNSKWVEVKKSYPPRELAGKKGDGKSKDGKGKGKDNGSKSKSTASPELVDSSSGSRNKNIVKKNNINTNPAISKGGSWSSGGKGTISDSRVTQLTQMGFSLKQSKRALLECGWDVNRALDKLFEEGIESEEEEEIEEITEQITEVAIVEVPPHQKVAEEEDVSLPVSSSTNKKQDIERNHTENISTASGSIDEQQETYSNKVPFNALFENEKIPEESTTYNPVVVEEKKDAEERNDVVLDEPKKEVEKVGLAALFQPQESVTKMDTTSVQGGVTSGSTVEASAFTSKESVNKHSPSEDITKVTIQSNNDDSNFNNTNNNIINNNTTTTIINNNLTQINQNIVIDSNNQAETHQNQEQQLKTTQNSANNVQQHDWQMQNSYQQQQQYQQQQFNQQPQQNHYQQQQTQYNQFNQQQYNQQQYNMSQQQTQINQQQNPINQHQTQNNQHQYNNNQQQQQYNNSFQPTSTPEVQPDKFIVNIQAAFDPSTHNTQQDSGNQQFLKVNAGEQVHVSMYNSGGTGWSFGSLNGTSGWFPTQCAKWDIVKTMYEFKTAPESSRNYLIFQQNQKICVEKRDDCGWWIGYIIDESKNGTLSEKKGFFPHNYVMDDSLQAVQGNQQT